MKKQEQKLIENFFTCYSPTHAIPRVNEALAIQKVKLIAPCLDLGCGDGKFALLTFGRRKIEVGLDQNKKRIAQAEKSGAYKKVVAANAWQMPFRDGEFGSVIANSVLEHVENLDGVLKEIARILQKGGILILTVPTPLVSKYQFWSKLIPGWAEFKKRLWKHINYFGEEEWSKRLQKAGFKLLLIEKTNSKNAIYFADLFFPLIFLGPLKPVIPFLEKRKVFGLARDGATSKIVAEKK